ncbi:MAG: TonB-dependent receptor [Opitutae bacterium]|nr:TonB-dependent receptor [Opitutae bacterium]
MSKPYPHLIILRLVAIVMIFGGGLFARAATDSVKTFALPEGDAAETLKLFVAQSNEQIVYPPLEVRGVVTHAVDGSLTPHVALMRMLEGTELVVLFDERTGALAIKRTSPPAPSVQGRSSARDEFSARAKDSLNAMKTTNTRTPTFQRVLGALAAMFVGTATAVAQPSAPSQELGAITGQVVNQATGDYLVGAALRINGTEYAATSEIGGYYRISTPAGQQVLSVNYSGLNTANVTVTVPAGQTVTQRIDLTSEVYTLDTFVVKSIREGSAAAIQNQRQALTPRSVAAIDAFGNPGASVGELMMRLPGVAVDGSGGEVGGIYIRGMSQDFSSLLLDGNQIAVSGGTAVSNGNVYFGQVSSGSVASMELIKAPTPDMEGNAIAGYMNLRTKRAFDRTPGRNITLTAGTAWSNGYQDSSVPLKDKPALDLFNLNYSDVRSVFGGRNNFGFSVSMTRSINNGLINEYGPRQIAAAQNAYVVPAPAPGADLQPLLRAYGAGQWGTVGPQWPSYNYAFNADLKVTNDTVVYLRSTYSRGQRRSGATSTYFRWKLSASQSAANFDLPNSSYDVVNVKSGGTLDLESVVYNRESESFTFASGLDQKLLGGSAKLTIDTSYSSNRTMYPQLYQLGARMTGVGFRIDRRGRDPWHPLVTQTAGANWSDPASYGVRPNCELISYSAPAERWSMGANFQKDFVMPLPGFVKVGVKQSAFQQSVNRELIYNTYAGPVGGTGRFVGYNMLMSDSTYGPFPFLQLPKTGLAGDVWQDPANWRQSASDVWNTIVNSTLNDVRFSERINAAYVMASTKIWRVKITTGLRFEETRELGFSYKRVINANNTNLSTATPEVNAARARDNFRGMTSAFSKYHNYFPGMHFLVDLGHNLQARASYSRSISRPSPDSLLPRIAPNEINSTLSAGNPDLKPYTSDNFELSLEKYFEPVGTVSASVFHKEITNYFGTIRDTVPSGPDNGFGGQYAGWEITQNRNMGNARINGAELSYSQQYTFLPGIWRGLGFFANFTYIDTFGTFGSTDGRYTTRLANLTPRSYNAGLSFKHRGFDIRVLGNYRSAFLKSIAPGTYGTGGISGTTQYEAYQNERTLIDIKTQYTINRVYSLYFDVYNITNDFTNSDVIYAFGRRIPSYASGAGTSFKAGVTARF